MGWWSQMWRKRAEDWVVGWLDASQVPDSALSGEIEQESSYLNIFLKSARVVNVRVGLRRFYGAVHSFMQLPHRSQKSAEFNVVTTPAALKNVDADDIDRVIQLNKRLLGPVPYVGGDLEIEVGLFSIASSDLAAPYLALLESLSNTAGVSFISSALPFAAPILEGVKLLAGSDKDSILEVGLSMTEPKPRQGYYVAVRAPKRTLEFRSLKVDPSDFRLLDSDGRPVADYPYIVLEVRGEMQRPDWFEIPDLATAYRGVQEQYRLGNRSETEEALEKFRRTALTCNDLQIGDARKLADKLDGTYKAIGPPESAKRGRPSTSATPRGTTKRFPDLRELSLFGP